MDKFTLLFALILFLFICLHMFVFQLAEENGNALFKQVLLECGTLNLRYAIFDANKSLNISVAG